jgi:hypothetical protein
MAHEATHVVQQSGGVQRMVQRTNGTPPGSAPASTASTAPASSDGTVDPTAKTITIPQITLPTFKIARHKDVYSGELVVPNKERDTEQVKKWKEGVKGNVDAKVDEKLKGVEYVKSPTSGQKIYFLQSTGTADFYIFGTSAAIKSESAIPYWDPLGRERLMAVDHRKEIQLGGDDDINRHYRKLPVTRCNLLIYGGRE